MEFEPHPPDCSGCKVSGLQHGAKTLSKVPVPFSKFRKGLLANLNCASAFLNYGSNLRVHQERLAVNEFKCHYNERSDINETVILYTTDSYRKERNSCNFVKSSLLPESKCFILFRKSRKLLKENLKAS